MSTLVETSSERSFGGYQKVFSHESEVLKCPMNFSVFIPTQAEDKKVPCIYWLSGLTCTEQNFIQKSGAQKYAAEHGFVVVAPDTSPRGCKIEGEDDSYDFGSGAGFYVDATEEKWKTNYNMFTYITQELSELIDTNFPVLTDKQSIMGHSMGGHGALICALKNPGKYQSVSAFAPICNPMKCAWGKKAFSGYLGSDEADWESYDACMLMKKYNGPPLEILVDQGKKDNFLKEGQLLPENLVTAATENKQAVILRMQEDYTHSYYFIASFIEDHFKHHAEYLK